MLPKAEKSLNELLYDIKRIEEHREILTEKKIRAMYQTLAKDLRSYLAEGYEKYADTDGRFFLSYLDAHNQRANFLEEIVKNVDNISPDLKEELLTLAIETYSQSYEGMVKAVKKANSREELARITKDISVQPDVLKQAVDNNISKLTLPIVMEKHRAEIIYQIQQVLTVGLANGDRYEQMAKRISERIGVSESKARNIARTETHRNVESGFMDCAEHIQSGIQGSEYIYAATWRTMDDNRVRPQVMRKTKKGWKKTISKNGANHIKMEGQTVKVGEMFNLGNGVKAKAPSQSGVAAHDCNCRCFLEYNLMTVEEFAKATEQTVEQIRKKYNMPIERDSKVSQGKDMVGKIDYSNSSFDYSIETAMNAQGFDGLPQVVSRAEFEKAMKQSNFYAERTYSATSQEILDEYRNQLYNGKWYVDCGTGGAVYGQGMYTAATYDIADKKAIEGITRAMKQYQNAGYLKTDFNLRDGFVSYTEGITLKPDAKILAVNSKEDIEIIYRMDYAAKNAISKEAKETAKELEELYKKRITATKKEYDEISRRINDLEFTDEYFDEIEALEQKAAQKIRKEKINQGALAVEMGYDAINASAGLSGSYTVILNRTKIILNQGGSFYGG